MRVAITGHRPDPFIQSHYSQEKLAMIIDGVVATFDREHGEDLSFNLGGAIGADQWVGQACIENAVKFHLYLPFLPEVQSKYWGAEQKQQLSRQIEKASSVTIVDPSGNYEVWRYEERNRIMIDDADILVAFWVGKKRGGTYNAIKYALSKSKPVLHALDNLRWLFKEDLSKGWTPPTMTDRG